MKFKKGDRIKVHATLNGRMVESKGMVLFSDTKTGRLELEIEHVQKAIIYAHPKQCRKLVRKKQ